MSYGQKETMGEMLERITKVYSANPAIICDDRVITYSEMYEMAQRFAYALYKRGVRQGDKVGIWMPNLAEWVVAWWGIPMIGAVIVPMDHWYKPSEAEYILSHSDAVGVVTYHGHGKWRFLEILEDIKDGVPNLQTIVVAGKEFEIKGMDVGKVIGFNDFLEMGRGWEKDSNYLNMQKEVSWDDVAFILYTSGTTGKPKGVMLTHHQIIKNAYDQGEVLQTTQEDRLLVQVPFSHCFGCVMSITLMVSFGGSIVPLEVFEPKKAMELVDKHRCTMMHGVPTMFIRELEVLKTGKYDVSTLRTGIMAGAPCPVDVMSTLLNDIGCNVCITYGLTEASPGVTMTRMNDTIKDRVETVGRALPDVEVKIVDDNGNEVPYGTHGEIMCRGYNVMKGYYKMPEATRETITEAGWLHTGDMGVMDDRGYVRVVGRKKEMVIVGGFNVYPREIEEFLRGFDKIEDVAVVGVPDRDLGEVVGVAVIPKAGSKLEPQEVVDFAYGKIASAKVPRYVYITDRLPVSGRGKVQKFVLSKILQDAIEKGELERVVPTKVKNKS